jgi:hypothetical protein
MMLAAGLTVATVLERVSLGAAAIDAPAVSGAVDEADPARRGAYLVTVGACNDCHTPFKLGPRGPEPDMTVALSGHPAAMTLAPPPALSGGWVWAGAATNTAFAGPWGVSYAANLTPDKATGLGNWTETMFVDALKSGKHAGVGRPILPPMPWPAYSQMTDADLKAMFAYLRTIKPVVNAVPAPTIAAPGLPVMK